MSELEKISPQSTSMIQVIERAALNSEVNVEKMERLLEMKERIDAKQSEIDFNIAMSRSQSQLTRISADSNNPQTKSRYASYVALDKEVRPIYTENGFSLSYDTGESTEENSILVMCYVSHNSGHTRTYRVHMDTSGKGAKGGDVMTKTHATGSAMAYGMRYLLKLIFNIAVGENDDDGNSAGRVIEYIDENLVNIIHAKLTTNNIDMVKFKDWLKRELKVDSIEKIPLKAYNILNRRIDQKIQATQRVAK